MLTRTRALQPAFVPPRSAQSMPLPSAWAKEVSSNVVASRANSTSTLPMRSQAATTVIPRRGPAMASPTRSSSRGSVSARAGQSTSPGKSAPPASRIATRKPTQRIATRSGPGATIPSVL